MSNKNAQQNSDDWKGIDPIVAESIVQISQEKPILDAAAAKKDAHAAGVKEGLEQTAINMIKEGVSDEFITKVTGLSFEKVEQLRKQHQ
ncbi:hypothetical protein [Metasolibacillus sp.]|uniref:hypothetical protein n=1 Tax=Metasolibacillus sp. TaxID=2703680 RepID=UPI0025D78CE9|nr:hypothetical protein [Metasolibacillus sp.]MCT6923400.1 hypothetical protein [Metasolibacillus sp.]MCT6939878.1 hypothetical protein [Metasolibacillus sp.]